MRGLALLLLLLGALLLAPARAWRWGSGGRARWSLQCQFSGSASSIVAAHAPASSAHCGDLCLLTADCSHWGWTPLPGDAPAGDGTCWLRGGASAAVSLHGVGTCGFLPDRFELDEAEAFDLGVGPLAAVDSGQITDREVETLLRTLNLLRLGRGAARLELDARLLLAARDLAATCPAADAAWLPVHGLGDALALAVVTPSDAPAQSVLDSWVSAAEEDPQAATLFSPNVSAVGLAKAAGGHCRSASATTTVWTLLLA